MKYKPHTIHSIVRYLGQIVVFKGKECQLLSATVTPDLKSCALEFKSMADENWTQELEYVNGKSLEVKDVFPLLKDYTQLLTPMIFKGENILPISYIMPEWKCKKYWIEGGEIWGSDEKSEIFLGYTNTPWLDNSIDKQVELGFAAFDNNDSPTSFVDLLGYPCQKKV